MKYWHRFLNAGWFALVAVSSSDPAKPYASLAELSVMTAE